MYIKSIKLKNFRNYKELYIDDFSEKINVISGKNAQGKTNLLEAFCLCSGGKSFRVLKDSFMIKDDEENAYIKIIYDENSVEKKIEILLSRNSKKSVKISGCTAKKINELYGKLCVEVFSPEDLKIIRESPSLRRKFLDMEISRIRPSYIDALKNYNKIITEKNAALKTKCCDEMIDIYNENMEKYISVIRNNRIKYINKLNEYVGRIMKSMEEEENIEFIYIPSIKNENIRECLNEVKERELKEKQCVIGTQRDEIAIKINGKEAKNFASQGQTRSIVLAMKIAAVYINYEWTGKISILMLDDVFSELDAKRKNWVIKSVKNIQTFITTANDKDAQKIGGKIYSVRNGSIEKNES